MRSSLAQEMMRFRHAIGSRVITIEDDDRVFTIRRDSELEGAITCDRSEVGYRVYGPFGQGYRIGLYNDMEEIETLEYHWREGACIHPGPREAMLDCHEYDFSRGRGFGSIVRKEDVIEIECPSEVTPLNPIEVGLLAILDHLWSRRLDPFSKEEG
jgi:hypothetical protein